MRVQLTCLALSLFAAGCASVPPVAVNYYPAAAATDLKVVQSVGCGPAGHNITVGYVVNATTSYFRRPGSQPHSLRLANLGGDWADASGAFVLTDDGRLSSVNTTSTGQGEAIVKTGTALFSLLTAGVSGDTGPCAPVRAANKDAVVSLVYTGRIEHFADGTSRTPILELDQAGMAMRQAITGLAVPEVTITRDGRLTPPLTWDGARAEQDVALTLNHTESVTLRIAERGSEAFWRGTIIVPEADTYEIPVPRAALFGGHKFELVLSPAGRPTTGSFTQTSGAAGAMTAAGTVLTSMEDDSTVDRAADAKAEADLIAQSQRLVRCRANPEACT